MFKTLSAALLAVSVLAAPAFAGSVRTMHAPVHKAAAVKASVLNAHAKMGRHHPTHVHVRHHGHHKFVVKRARGHVVFKHAPSLHKRG